MEIRHIEKNEQNQALDLIWRVFLQFEAPDYPEEGVETFRSSVIENDEYLNSIEMYGAFIEKKLVGVMATRNHGTHVALFFVDGTYQKQGIGRRLCEAVIKNCKADGMTVNASPYAVPIYEHLGFMPTDTEQITDGMRYTPMIRKIS